MDDSQLIMLFAITAVLLMVAFCVLITWRMQNTIDVLTSKLMAKDLKEYSVTINPEKKVYKALPTEQLSWFDDPQEVKGADA